MLNIYVTSTNNSLTYVKEQGKSIIRETFEVKLDYEKNVTDITAYDEMVKDLMKTLLRHCPTAGLPIDPGSAIIPTSEEA